MKKNGLSFQKTCDCCPEQYNVNYGNDIVAYINLRFGKLTVYETNKKGDIKIDNIIFEAEFQDNMKSSFYNDEERNKYLNECKEFICDYYNEIALSEDDSLFLCEECGELLDKSNMCDIFTCGMICEECANKVFGEPETYSSNESWYSERNPNINKR